MLLRICYPDGKQKHHDLHAMQIAQRSELVPRSLGHIMVSRTLAVFAVAGTSKKLVRYQID